MLAQNYTSPPYTLDDNHSPRPARSFYPQHLDDLDAISLDDHSLDSSLSIPRHLNVDGLLYLSQSSSPRAAPGDQLPTPQQYHLDPMQSESSWLAGGQYVPKSVGRLSHHRESSLSSLGSAGPASPYSHNTANPQIAVTDSGSDGFSDMPSHDNSYYQLAKTMGSGHDGLYASYSPFGGDAQGVGSGYHAMGAAHRFKGDRSLLPAPELSSPFGPNRSHPASVASSIAGDSPATPSLGEPEDDRRRKTILTNVPKLDRTMTDVYSDELYNPNFSITSATSPHVQIPMSPQHDVFTQRLQAANSQHLTAAAHSPVSTSSRSRSPFRNGSPLAPAPAHDFGASAASNRLRYNTAQQMRDQQKAEQDAQARQRMSMKSEPETPKTISPKDAILEFHEPEGDANFPLFPSQDTFLYDHMPKAEMSHVDNDGYHRSSSASTGSDFRFASAQLPASIQVPQQYPFIAHSRLLQDSPPRLSSTDSSSTGSPGTMSKPLGTIADGGTYTCTYHGCTLRFDSPALLQKHKREGHRQAQGLSSPTHQPELGVPASLMTQAGPHRCDRINPSTGKPCSTVFSRPYDLTRHEDTIHNARKLKVRCNLCTEEKTFSRADALTRHYRVCHPDVEFPGKHRRRGGH